MTATVFVDTNVFIYAVDQTDLKKQSAAQAWRSWLWKTNRGCISFQVLQEFYVKAKKIRPSATDAIRSEISDLMAWQPISVNAAVISRAWRIEDRFRISFWDALIVSAAIVAGCTYLLTEDLQTGQQFDTVLVVNPFVSDPSSLES
jgi:predicted nucleic acid-binding protein